MKTIVATLTAAVLALAAVGVAQAGHPGKSHDTHYSDRSRHDDHYGRYYEPCYEYPCYGEPCYDYSCYPYFGYDYGRRSREFERGREPGRGPRK